MPEAAKNTVFYLDVVGENNALFVNYTSQPRLMCRSAGFPELPSMNPEPLPPYRGAHHRIVRVLKFEEYTTVANANARIREAGYEPGDLWMLLTLADRYPAVQRDIPILATGTTLRLEKDGGQPCFACLRWDGFINTSPLRVQKPEPVSERVRTLDFLPAQFGFESRYYYLAAKPIVK